MAEVGCLPDGHFNNLEVSGSINRMTPKVLLDWNYISCGGPICSSVDNTDATTDGRRFSMIMPGKNGEMYPADVSLIAATAAATVNWPTVEGTIPATDTNATQAGLNIELDATTVDDAGMEFRIGPPHGNNYSKFVVGKHSGYIDATFCTGAKWTEWDCVCIGFRKAEAATSAAADVAIIAAATGNPTYADLAAIGNTNGDDISTTTCTGGGAITATDGGQAPTDSRNMRLRVNLAADGAVTYQFVLEAVAGAGTLGAMTGAVAYSFTDALEVIPCIWTLHAGTGDDPIFLKDIKIVRNLVGSSSVGKYQN